MKKWMYYLYGVAGIIGLWLFIDHLCNFNFPNYFYNQNPGITKFIGVNVVSPWADFSFFTYHSLIFFSIWCLLQTINSFIKSKLLAKLINSEKVFAFITTNYLLTIILYVIFEGLAGEATFGLYANVPLAWHNFGTNILVHFVIGAFVIANFFIFKPTSSAYKYYYFPISAYLISYFTIVRLTGKYCYVIEWYPYFIFDPAETWKTFHLPNANQGIQVATLIALCLIIFVIYFVIFNNLMKMKRFLINKSQK